MYAYFPFKSYKIIGTVHCLILNFIFNTDKYFLEWIFSIFNTFPIFRVQIKAPF